MADWPTSMLGVVERVRGLDPNRPLKDVVTRLLEIEREKDGYRNPARRRASWRLWRIANPPDGVACFNFMYLRVTEEVLKRLRTFQAPPATERLAVVFAEFYFTAYGAARDLAWISKAWAPLIEKKSDRGIVPLQFAIGGMNAHINNDLTWALLQVWKERGVEPDAQSPEYADFVQVNTLLAAVQEEVRRTLQRGFLKWLDRLLGRTDDVVAQFVIGRARQEAWERARRWLGGVDAARAETQDRQVGYQTHLILGA
jgi:hypothetical protein